MVEDTLGPIMDDGGAQLAETIPGWRRWLRPAVLLGGVVAWEAAVILAGSTIEAKVDVNDYTVSHMGSYAQKWWFVATIWAAALLPALVIPILEGIHHRFLSVVLATALTTTAIVRAVSVLGGYSTCEMGQIPTHDLRATIILLASVAVVPFVVLFWLGSRRGVPSHSQVSVATVGAGLNAYLLEMWLGACSGPSSQINRGFGIIMFFPLFLIEAYMGAVAGGWLGARYRAGRPPWRLGGAGLGLVSTFDGRISTCQR